MPTSFISSRDISFCWQVTSCLKYIIHCGHLLTDNIYFIKCFILQQWYQMNIITRFNSLRPGDAIWRHRSGLTLTQVMACCLTAPSHYLDQFWFLSNGFCDIHLRTISKEMLMTLIRHMCSEIALLKLLPNKPEANQLICYLCIFVHIWYCYV